MQAQIDSTMKYEISYAICCPIWYHLYNFKNVKKNGTKSLEISVIRTCRWI